jgi:hypothetical protein
VTRTLSRRHLNRAVLARQMLLERAELPVHRVVERMAGVQSQYVPSAYVGLWSRRAGSERPDVTGALERRSVVQGTLMRGTIHLVSRADYWPFAAAIGDARRRWWLRTTRHSGDGMDELAGRLRDVLAGGPMRRTEIVRALGIDITAWNGLGLWVDLVRVPPSGTWERRRADVYALAEDWVGANTARPEQGRDLLVRRYLGGFGPATREDVLSFTGLSPDQVDATLARIATRRMKDEEGRPLLDVPRAPLPGPDVPAPVRFLGTWDATLLVHARRSGILPERFRSRIFHTKAPHSFNTFLVDGAVAGTWRHDEGRVAVEPFEPLTARDREEVGAEADRLGAFLA